MGRFFGGLIGIVAAIIIFQLCAGGFDWVARSLRGTTSAVAATPVPVTSAGTGSIAAAIPASGSASGSAAIAPATASAPAAAATVSATTSVAVAPASGSAVATTSVEPDDPDAIIAAATASVDFTIPYRGEFDGDLYTKIASYSLEGLGWSGVNVQPADKSTFSAQTARHFGAVLESHLEAGGATVAQGKGLTPLNVGLVVEQGLDPLTPKRVTGQATSYPRYGIQTAVVFDWDCGDPESCYQGVAHRALNLIEHQAGVQEDPQGFELDGVGISEVTFTNSRNPTFWDAAVMQSVLNAGGRRVPKGTAGAIAYRGEIYLVTALRTNDPQEATGYLKPVSGDPRYAVSFRVKDCTGWGICADEVGKRVTFRIGKVRQADATLARADRPSGPHGVVLPALTPAATP